MHPICIRLKQWMDSENLTSYRLSAELGYKGSEKISRLFRDEEVLPSIGLLEDISKKYDYFNLDWVITGEGDMLKSTLKKVPKTTPKPHFLPPNVEKTIPKHTFKEPEIPYFETPTATPTIKKHHFPYPLQTSP